MKKVGISMRGGAAKSISYLGVFRFLEQHDIPISAFLASSGGSLVASTYAAGIPIEDIVEYLESHAVSKNRSIKSILRGNYWDQDKAREWGHSLIGNRTIESLYIPTYIQVTNLTRLKNEIIENGLVSFWCNASCAFPFLETPYIFNDEMYGDGDLTSGYDSRFLRSRGCDYVIGLNIKTQTEPLDDGLKSKAKALIYASRKRVLELDMAIDKPDLIVEIEADIGYLEFHKPAAALRAGYYTIGEYSDQLFKDLELT